MVQIGIWFEKVEEGRSSIEMGWFRLGLGFLGLSGALVMGFGEEEGFGWLGWYWEGMGFRGSKVMDSRI